MTDSPFRGVIPPVVIPLTEKRQLDLEALERSINRMIDAGVDGLFFLGSSGEVAFLTDAQRYHVLQEAIAMVHGRVPVLTGIIDMETMRGVDQAKRATGYGVDALVATAPFYALGGPKEVKRHFRAIREHTDMPLFAYDLPACVHTKLDPTMLVRLGEDDVKAKFPAMYNAFCYGAPPHAGIAPGVDRMVMLLAGEDCIREIIPFPMNKNAQDVMMGAPGTVEPHQIEELHIAVVGDTEPDTEA